MTTNRERADAFLESIGAWDNMDAHLLGEALAEAEARGRTEERAVVVALASRLYAAGYQHGHEDTAEGRALPVRSWIPEEAALYESEAEEIVRDHARNGGGDAT